MKLNVIFSQRYILTKQPIIMQSLSCATYQLKNGINFNPQRAQQTNKTSIKM